ncbi:WD repeat-containing protein 46-like [Mya arenaria]|uniref:WD repeat-containing protein 46-like n=1 Tax=Mya arenaria TaxID=6604 RepID=UPI0022E0EB6D|nr:WD repeat-containing protein 46-like [Mya arenaria]
MENKETDSKNSSSEQRVADKSKFKKKVKRYYDIQSDETQDTKKKKSKNRSAFKMMSYANPGEASLPQKVYKVDIARTDRHRVWEKKQQHKLNKLINRENMRTKEDPFPGEKPVPLETIQKYKRGDNINSTHTRTVRGSKDLARREKKVQSAAKESARTELLLQEESGCLQAEDGEDTTSISQHDLAKAVDISSAEKFFELKLPDFGPYRLNYTRNGRFLLIGGHKGHVAAIDWMTKKLLCEVNVMETVNDIKWLHQETMYAVAQKQWTYIYDNQGIELHCLKRLDSVLRMEFLPYHFLLATANAKGYLSYIDVSIGEKVAGYGTQMGRLDVMCQNPSNAVVALGHSGGTVTMWCPKMKEAAVKMLCHSSGVRSIAINKDGHYLATSGIDRTMRIWDLRTYKQLQSYKVRMGAGQLAFSQTGLLTAGMGNVVEVYEDCIRQTVQKPYLVHHLTSSVTGVQFCPYEDVLGVGHSTGFSSLIIPGAGEANFDALESNPYQTKKQRKEAEVKMLLEKIPADMIHLDSNVIVQVDKKGLEDAIEQHNQLKHLKPQKMEYEPRYKKKGRSKGQKLIQRKKGVVEEAQRDQIRESLNQRQTVDREREVTSARETGHVLDRFRRKDKT